VTELFAIHLGREALYVALLVAAPMLGLALIVGLIISILQATTQLHEQTLSFVPKLAEHTIITGDRFRLRIFFVFAGKIHIDY